MAIGAGGPPRSGVSSGTHSSSGADGTSDATEALRTLRASSPGPSHHSARSRQTVEAVVALGARQSSGSSGTVIAFVTSRARLTRASVQSVATRSSIFAVSAAIEASGSRWAGVAWVAIESAAASGPGRALCALGTGFAGQAAGTWDGFEMLESNDHAVEPGHVRGLLLSEFGYGDSVCGFAAQRLAELRFEKRV